MMENQTVQFHRCSTTFYFDASFDDLKNITHTGNSICITDVNLFQLHKQKFEGWQTIVINAGEQFKNQQTADEIIKKLIELNADRKTVLIGIGGGVVTDITGYVASVFLRGIKFGFIPTTVLAMVDASIGGKNGIDVGVYKNMVGTINQPDFILYDIDFLLSLSENEWRNGFAEIIKHACIKDAAMFDKLEEHSLENYMDDAVLMAELIKHNALLKAEIVVKDEFETGDRKLLNFGHTFGHAIENTYQLRHGFAVAIGMVMACNISSFYTNFTGTNRVTNILKKYGLPTYHSYNIKNVLQLMMADKKKVKDIINYVLLKEIGNAFIQPVALKNLEEIIIKAADKNPV